MEQPWLIVICGAPASGKTNLARRLATDLKMPLIEKDVIKESLAESIPTPDRETSKRIGAASFRVLYDLAIAMLERSVDVMIEANLSRPYADAALARMASVSRVMIVQCEADRETIERRYRDRHAAGGRHAAHFDLDALPDLRAGLDDGRYDLTDLGYPNVTVCTNDGYVPAYAGIAPKLALLMIAPVWERWAGHLRCVRQRGAIDPWRSHPVSVADGSPA